MEDIDNIYLEITDKYFTRINKIDDEDKDFVKRYKEKKINFRDLFELNEIKNLVKLNRFKSDQINKKLVDDYIKIVIDTKNNVLPTKLLTIIILPDERSFKKYNTFEHYFRINYIKKKFQENQISVIDLPTQFKEKYNFLDFYYSRYTHYNEKAQKLIAEIIIENIKEKKLD